MPTSDNKIDEEPNGVPAAPPKADRKRTTQVVGVIVLIGILFFGYRLWSFNSTHVATDDAYLTSNVVTVSPEVSGKVINVLVIENQRVRKGDLVALLDGTDYLHDVSRAQAALTEAQRAVQAIEASIAYTQSTGTGQIQQAQGSIEQASGNEASLRAQYTKAKAGVRSALAGRGSASANLANAGAGIKQAISALARAKKISASATSQVDAARAALLQTKSQLTAAQAVADRASKDEIRYQALIQEGVVTQSQYEQVSTTAESARAEVTGAEARIQQAEATLSARQSEADSAKEQINQAVSQIEASRAQQTAMLEVVKAADASISSSQAAVNAAGEDITTAQGKKTEAAGKLVQAQTVSGQVKVLEAQRSTAQARVREAEVALEVAQKNLDRTKVVAPVDGLIGKKNVEVGERVEVGSPLMAIVESEDLWVQANFKETQLQSMLVGQHVEIDVDALSGSFNGHVASLSPGTGAVFSLLPPDNATGNFTKVIQRVPVRIELDPGQPNRERLRSGLSVKVTVRIKE